ncbi:hypothetical protein [Colwellia sp. Bg11-12]|uniref:hypothetical protein n=1 Tax=Colwellia sp. Bg11-12 TaxID=2759817 RepID=UPI0015F5C717|nr:hypothetical protein [Colwellia sp. Bg11-12]MBA6265414.1 hypothetical protein [Colwellia sp. Bg11-12]
MEIDLDVVVKKNEYQIDMQYGLDTLKGTSDVTCIIAESILNLRVPEKRTRRSDVRSNLKGSFEGSYGQRFSIKVNDEVRVGRLQKIGKEAFMEVLSYFIREALYLENEIELSKKAEAVVLEMEPIADELIKRVANPLKEIHKIPSNYGNEVVLNYKATPDSVDKTPIANFNGGTATNLSAVVGGEVSVMEIMVSRFNSLTGNGRFLTVDAIQTFSFGFGAQLESVRKQLKLAMSRNLHSNNAALEEDRGFMKVNVKKMTLPNGRIVKYIVTGLAD